jgi:hypothetical protein
LEKLVIGEVVVLPATGAGHSAVREMMVEEGILGSRVQGNDGGILQQ